MSPLSVISCLLSRFLRRCRVVRASATWWRSAHLGLRAGCRLPLRPLMLQDTYLKTRPSLPSPLIKSKLAFTTTRAKDLSARLLPSTQQKKVRKIKHLVFQDCMKSPLQTVQKYINKLLYFQMLKLVFQFCISAASNPHSLVILFHLYVKYNTKKRKGVSAHSYEQKKFSCTIFLESCCVCGCRECM